MSKIQLDPYNKDQPFSWKEDTCEHGMASWLCMGPNHYPSDRDEMEGRYF